MQLYLVADFENELVERLALALDVDRSRLERLHPRARLDAVLAHVLERERQRRDWIASLLRDIELAAGREHLEVTAADDVGDDVQVVGVERGLERVIVQILGRDEVIEEADLRTPDGARPRPCRPASPANPRRAPYF